MGLGTHGLRVLCATDKSPCQCLQSRFSEFYYSGLPLLRVSDPTLVSLASLIPLVSLVSLVVLVPLLTNLPKQE